MRTVPYPLPLLLMLSVVGPANAQPPGGNAAVRAAKQILGADASRPGDADLSCEQIGAEMERMFAGMDDMHTMLANAERANEEVDASQGELERRQAVEGPALEAAAMAQTKAAIKMSINPVAGLPEAIDASTRMEALHQEQFRKANQGGRAGAAALGEFKGSAQELLTDNTGELARMRVLTELAEQKGCVPPEGAPGLSEDGYFEDEGE